MMFPFMPDLIVRIREFPCLQLRTERFSHVKTGVYFVIIEHNLLILNLLIFHRIDHPIMKLKSSQKRASNSINAHTPVIILHHP